MVSRRIKKNLIAATLFAVVCGLMASSAFAAALLTGSTNKVALEALKTDGTTDITVGQVTYTMGINRTTQDSSFIIRFALNGGVFAADAGQPTVFIQTAATGVVANRTNGGAGASLVEFEVSAPTTGTFAIGDQIALLGATTPGPVLNFTLAPGATVNAASTMTLGVALYTSAQPLASGGIDGPPPPNISVVTIGLVASFTALTDSRTTIDATATPPRSAFVPGNGGDTTATLTKALVTTVSTVPGTLKADGSAAYVLLTTDQITFTISGDFTGVASVGFDLDNSGAITTSALTSTNENFTINGTNTAATLTVDGSRLGVAGTKVFFVKTAGSVLTPRTFGISAVLTPAAGFTTRSLNTANPAWEIWSQNGTTLTAVYLTFSPGNAVKFRFTNSLGSPVTVTSQVTLDFVNGVQNGTCTLGVLQGALSTGTFTIPASGSIQVELSANGDPTTGTLGPLCTLTGGTQPVRGKGVFTVLTATGNVSGLTLIASPVGVITAIPMQQVPAIPQ